MFSYAIVTTRTDPDTEPITGTKVIQINCYVLFSLRNIRYKDSKECTYKCTRSALSGPIKGMGAFFGH